MRHLTAIVALFALVLLVTGNTVLAEDKPTSEAPLIDVKVGDTAPIFTSIDEGGQPWASSDHLGKQYIVLYFYPADFTTGCIKQAETFRDTMNLLADRGIAVIGVSGDGVRNHQLFKEHWKLNYTLLADETGDIAKKFGVPV